MPFLLSLTLILPAAEFIFSGIYLVEPGTSFENGLILHEEQVNYGHPLIHAAVPAASIS
jgi:hypothetical protein